jgi:hypothetical protein
MSKTFWGDALPKRPKQKTNKFSNTGGFTSSLDGVRVDVRTDTKGSRYSIGNLEGTEFTRMKRYALMLTKWSHHDTAKHAKRWRVTQEAAEAANRVITNHLYQQVFLDDPTQDTINLTPYVNAYKQDFVTKDLITATLSLHGTRAIDTLLSQIHKDNPLAHEVLSDAIEAIDNSMDGRWHWIDYLHETDRRTARYASYCYESIANIIDQSDDSYRRKRRGDKKGKGKTTRGTGDIKPGDSAKETFRANKRVVLPIDEYNDGGWERPYLAKHELELPHTGKKGRRLIPANEGKTPKMFYRMVSDPYKRIFQRKTRSLGGVVIFDCSGSMGLSDEDIKDVMRSSSGCSIVCYSSGNDEWDAEHGNIHLVAKNGRQMRGLPDFPGNNGVDLPAIKWAYYNLRLNSKSPVVWVSDGQVTGVGDVCTDKLYQETQRFVKSKNIIQVETPKQAIQLLSRLQRGLRK